MDHQTTLETVVRHMFAQGVQSGVAGVSCLYRGPNGTSCAVGCLIPDDQYDPKMDNSSWPTHIRSIAPRFRDVPFFKELNEEDLDFLADLQYVHDIDPNWNNTAEMKRAIKRRFSDFDLSFMDELSFADR